FLAMLEAQFKQNSTSPLPAFEAVNYIASYVWQIGKSEPASVSVPWWAVQALAIGFNKYHDAAQSRAPITLGEAYKLEGGRQGRPPAIQRRMQELRDIRIALAIALVREKEGKIEAVLQEQAERAQLSLGRTRRIWEKYRKRAIRAVANFRTH